MPAHNKNMEESDLTGSLGLENLTNQEKRFWLCTSENFLSGMNLFVREMVQYTTCRTSGSNTPGNNNNISLTILHSFIMKH